jgi:hypothetical protein
MAYQFPIGRVTGIGASTPVKVLDGFVAPCGGAWVAIKNTGGQPIWLGQSGVTSTDGYPVNTGVEFVVQLQANEATDLYAISQSSGSSLAYFIGRAVSV